jgi:Ni/Co efflux regulator RcnB
MKRFALASAAALMMVGPLAGTASAQSRDSYFGGGASQRGDRDYDRGDRDNDRRGDRDDDRRGDRDNDRRDYDRRDNDRRGDRDHRRWSQRDHNGYYVDGRWNYGPPPAWAQGRRDYRPGYHQWRRGDRLPSYYRSHYRQVDWRRERFRQPPRGYHYVRDDRGEVLLVGIATGVILSILLSQ